MLRYEIILGVVALVLVSGCNNKPEVPPEKVAAAFLEAMSKGDIEGLKATTTEKARKFFQNAEKGSFSCTKEGYDSYEIGETTIKGNEAEVSVTTKKGDTEEKSEILLRNENNRWGVHSIVEYEEDGTKKINSIELVAAFVEGIGEAVSSGIEESVSEAFSPEKQQEEAEQKSALHRKRFDEVQVISESEYEKAWKNEEDFRGRSLQESLESLAARTGYPLDPGGFSDRLKEEVKVDVTDMSVLEAMERLAEQVELFPLFPIISSELGYFVTDLTVPLTPEEKKTTQDIVFSFGSGGSSLPFKHFREEDKWDRTLLVEGLRPYPIDFAGPYAVSVMTVNEFPERLTCGELAIVIQSFGLPFPISNSMSNYYPESMGNVLDFQFPVVTDQNDNPIAREQFAFSFMQSADAFYGLYSYDLFNLTSSFKAIPSIEGTVYVDIPEEIDLLVFEPVSEEMVREINDLQVKVDSISDMGSYYVNLSYEGENILEKKLAVFARCWDANNIEIPIENLSTDETTYRFSTDGTTETRLQTSITLPTNPNKIELKIMHNRKRISYDFNLREASLVLWEKRPETIMPLDYSPHSKPVSISYESREATEEEKKRMFHEKTDYYTFAVTNNSNRNITHVDVEPIIKNERFGETQANTIWLINFKIGGNVSQILEPGVTATCDAEIVFLSDDDIRKIQKLSISEVKFDDNTIWEPDELGEGK